MSDKTRVLLLLGGRSAEHEISIVSGRFIADSLDPDRFEAILVGIGKDGRWTLQRKAYLDGAGGPGEVTLEEGAPAASVDPMPPADGAPWTLRIEGRPDRAFDVVFPVLHGPQGEDGCVQGLFELMGVPYVGSGVASSAVGMDKVFQKQIFEHHDLPIAKYRAFDRRALTSNRQSVMESCLELPFPLFVKPANMGSSLGIRKATDAASLEAALDHAFEFDRRVVVEQGLEGAREIECAVLGLDDAQVSQPGEIRVHHDDGFYSYDAKYIDDDGATLSIPAELYHAEEKSIQILALRAFRALDGAGLARVDLFMDADRNLYLNEVNTMPGFTAISMYPQLWEASGVPARTLVGRLVDAALERHAVRANLRTTR